jgi:hydroxymethylpyrimidine pyrophosphatase-like HAD family hydrolase
VSAVALVISDVDGTLVTPEKTLTEASIRAVHRLHARGIGFTVISSLAGLLSRRDAAERRQRHIRQIAVAATRRGREVNRLAMFREAGLTIAMGNASEDAKREATHVTKSNAEDGFAAAIEEYVLAS